MPFLLALAVVAISVIAITYKTYVGYGEYPWYVKLGVLVILILGMLAPIISYVLHSQFPNSWISGYTKFFYLLFGFIFILFLVTLLRDVIWGGINFARHISFEEMKNPIVLQKANIWTVVICLFICLYGYYEAEKQANIVTYEISSPKIKKETKVVMLSDLHLDIDAPVKYVEKLVKRVNDLNPDAIVLVGDLVDNKPFRLVGQMKALQNLKAKDGVYFVLGNHEFYHSAFDWGIQLSQMKFNFLNNYGMKVDDSGLYIAGIPDINAATASKMPIKVENALHFAPEGSYVIMLSHAPLVAEGINKDNVDLILSAHTHGGQVFPFHYFSKQSNEGRLAGFYDIDGVKMYVSRGTRYWGIPMRILAPSEITVFDFKPEKKDGQPS